MTKVAIVGVGLIGRAWALSFARAGYEVALTDATPGAVGVALEFVDGTLGNLAGYDLLNGAKPAEVRKRIRAAADLADALAGASYVQESTPEKIEMKLAIFAELDRLAAPEAVIASS